MRRIGIRAAMWNFGFQGWEAKPFRQSFFHLFLVFSPLKSPFCSIFYSSFLLLWVLSPSFSSTDILFLIIIFSIKFSSLLAQFGRAKADPTHSAFRSGIFSFSLFLNCLIIVLLNTRLLNVTKSIILVSVWWSYSCSCSHWVFAVVFHSQAQIGKSCLGTFLQLMSERPLS